MANSLDAIDYADHNGMIAGRLVDKFRVQVPIILMSAALVQALSSLFLYDAETLPLNVKSSILIALFANFAGLLSFRRLRLFPGARRLTFIFPSFALTWMLALLAVLVLRAPYSVTQLTIGFAVASGLTLLLNMFTRRVDATPLLMIPSPRVEKILRDLPDLRHDICRSPDDIEGAKSVIVADLHENLPSKWESALAKAAVRGVPIYHVKHISESLTGRVQIEHLSENSFGQLAPDPSFALLKSVIERTLALVILVITLPIMLLAALAVRLDSPGPSFFRQTRIGYKGRPFRIIKLRTMTNRPGVSSREDDMTRDNDPRITRLGRFLRGSRLDEIPQLWNVLMGEMSIIGPRPETENLSNWYAETIDFYPYRHVVLPGITGWAQVKQGHVVSREDIMYKLQYDFYYIKHFSFWLDVAIILKTLKVVFLKLGAR